MDHQELSAALAAAGTGANHYAIHPEPSEHLPYDMDVYVLARDSDGRWFTGFGERGTFDVRRYFDSEDEACRYFQREVTGGRRPENDLRDSQESLRRRAGERLPEVLPVLDAWVAEHRAELGQRGIDLADQVDPEPGVVRRIVLSRGIRTCELTVRGPGLDSTYRRVDTGAAPAEYGNRVHLVHPEVAVRTLATLAFWFPAVG